MQESSQVLLCPARKELPLLMKAFQHQPSFRWGLHHTLRDEEFPEHRALGWGCILGSDWQKNPTKQTQTKNQMQTVRPTHFKNQTKEVQCNAFASLGLWKSILLLKDKHTSGIPVPSFSFSGQVQN